MIETNKIYNEDILNILPLIDTNSIHLIITSPPYNVGMDYGEEVNDSKNYQHYKEWIKIWLKECYRILIPGGRIAINLPSTILRSKRCRVAFLTLDYVLIMREIGFLDREWITWIKMPKGEIPAHSTSWGSWKSPSCPYMRDASETIIVMDKENHKRTDKKGENDIRKEEFMTYTSNCWYMQPEKNRRHPAPFPFELPYRLIKLYSWKNDIILDPFAGSGTTLLACKETNRQFIGVEINKEFYDMANNRINTNKLF